MQMRRFSAFYFCLLLCYFYFLVTGVSVAKQLPEKEKQIDVITLVIPEKKMVDVRKAARNLHNKEMYGEARRALVLSDNAYLSSSTVNLLKTALNDDSAEVRQRAIDLLCYCRNPEAIPLLADRLQNDPSWRVRDLAAACLGKLAGDAAVPLLKTAWTEDKNISRGVIYGLGYAGGTAVPFLIERLKEKIENNVGNNSAIWLIDLLGATGDRRVIEPLLDIISRPTSASDPNMGDVQLKAVRALGDLADVFTYLSILEFQFLMVDAMRLPESRAVNMADRVRILEFLKKIVESEPEYKVVPKEIGWVGMPRGVGVSIGLGMPIGSTGEKPVIQAAYDGVERIERYMALVEELGPEWWKKNYQERLRTKPKEKISSDGKK